MSFSSSSSALFLESREQAAASAAVLSNLLDIADVGASLRAAFTASGTLAEAGGKMVAGVSISGPLAVVEEVSERESPGYSSCDDCWVSKAKLSLGRLPNLCFFLGAITKRF